VVAFRRLCPVAAPKQPQSVPLEHTSISIYETEGTGGLAPPAHLRRHFLPTASRDHYVGFPIFRRMGMLCWQVYKQFFSPDHVTHDQLEPYRSKTVLAILTSRRT